MMAVAEVQAIAYQNRWMPNELCYKQVTCNQGNKKMNIKQFRNSLKFVALANFSYFWIEFAVATTIGSVSLFADSIDFLEDASVNFLILIALGWSDSLSISSYGTCPEAPEVQLHLKLLRPLRTVSLLTQNMKRAAPTSPNLT